MPDHEPVITLPTHVPNFWAVTEEERERGYSSRCDVCGRLLPSSIEIIGSHCRGKAAAR